MANYNDDSIRTMEGMKHIRFRPGMYIGGLGNRADPRHGIYTILKEVIDNSVDEFTMRFGKNIMVDVDEKTASVRDYGQGIPLGSVIKYHIQCDILSHLKSMSEKISDHGFPPWFTKPRISQLKWIAAFWQPRAFSLLDKT